MYHFLYDSFEEFPGGRDYIGAHSTEDLYDGYLGSFSDESFKPTGRIIISFYPDRGSLLKAEGNLQRSLGVVENPQYANRAYQTSAGFSTLGSKFPGRGLGKTYEWSEEAKENRKGSGNPNFGRKATSETRSVQSEKKLGDKNPMFGKSGELSPTYGRVKSETEIESCREKMKQKRWFVNPSGETRMFDVQPQGEWRPGRIWEED